MCKDLLGDAIEGLFTSLKGGMCRVKEIKFRPQNNKEIKVEFEQVSHYVNGELMGLRFNVIIEVNRIKLGKEIEKYFNADFDTLNF